MSKDAAAKFDKDLLEGLQQARKQKPRYYALFGKGADVVGLIVQKKVINEGAMQKAKAECKATAIIQGVCVGDGMELKFEVLEEEPNIQVKKIKDYIEARTELSLKPQWLVVTRMSVVVDDETAGSAPTPPVAAESAPAKASSSTAPSLQPRLKALLLKQKEVVAKAPALGEGILPYSKVAADLVVKNDATAGSALDKLEQMLTAAAPFAQHFAQLEPRYKEFLAQNPPDGAKATAVMTYALEQAVKGEFDKGLAALKRIDPMLAGGTASPKAPAGPGGSPATVSFQPLVERWRQARAAVAVELDKLRQSLLADDEIEADPRLRFVRAAAAEIPNLLPRTAAVDSALGGGAADLLLDAIAVYRDDLAAAAGFSRLEAYADQQLGVPLAARATLSLALDEMESSLRSAS
ncbi:MAG: hypothetical protein U0939_01055 [Pirellulales bacterium]